MDRSQSSGDEDAFFQPTQHHDEQYQRDLLTSVAAASRQAEELREENSRLHSEVSQLKEENSSLHDEMTELREENTKLLAEVADLKEENVKLGDLFVVINEMSAQSEDLTKQNQELLARVEELKRESDELRQEAERLTKEAEELKREAEKERENINPELAGVRREVKHLAITEEQDDLDPPSTPSTRAFPRQSIGQWSVERLKNNMSVKSMVNSMERGRVRDR